MTSKKILIGITGSIAAYKIPLLVRLLKKQGAEVQVVMTDAAKDFVTPLTLATLSGLPVLSKGFDPETGKWNSHVELGLWADLFVIAPASANTIAKMAHGEADNYLLTVCLSAKCPIMFAPAMDLDMYNLKSCAGDVATPRRHNIIIVKNLIGFILFSFLVMHPSSSLILHPIIQFLYPIIPHCHWKVPRRWIDRNCKAMIFFLSGRFRTE